MSYRMNLQAVSRTRYAIGTKNSAAAPNTHVPNTIIAMTFLIENLSSILGSIFNVKARTAEVSKLIVSLWITYTQSQYTRQQLKKA